jgi:Cof subfamily protein (haloacid dehalogenase superfamily)
MSIKLIFSDVDGTILPHGGRISDRTRNAVNAAVESGVPFVISSGRWYISAKKIADELNLADGVMIVANGGAIVRMDGSIVKEWPTPTADAWRAYEIMKKYDVMMNAFVRNAVYRINTRAFSKGSSLSDYLGDHYRVINNNVEIFEECGLVTPYKMEAYSDDYERLAKLRAELTEAGFSISSAYADNLEIMAPGCGKGTAVKWLAEHYGVTTDECMAFGDNTNDQSMLDAVGWPVAVENAVDSLKENAKIIAEKCEDDGVAKIIEQALRGEIG